jgi:hypothetical protein
MGRQIPAGTKQKAIRIMLKWLKQRGYFLWITFSMVLCAILFLPWFLPRETTSGLIGRWHEREVGWKHRFALRAAPWLDERFHAPFGIESCVDIYRLEEASREALYLRGELG